MIESKIKDDLKLKESVDFMGTLGSINDKEGVSTWSDLDILLILKSDEHGNVPVDIILKLKEIHNEVSNLFYGLEISLLTHTYHDFENYVSFEYLENYQFATIRSIFNEKEKLPKDFLKSVIEKREIDEETKKRFAIYYLRHMRFNLIRKIASWDGNDKAMAKLVVDRIMESAIWVMNYYGTFTQKKSERIDFIEKNIKDSKIVDIYKKCFKLRQEWPNITEEESMELIVTGLGYVGEIESYMDKKYPEPTPEELMNIISMTK